MRTPIAIVGMGCRFPGAPNLQRFWELVCSGASSYSSVPQERWNHSLFHDADARAPHCTYAELFGFCDGVFDFAPEAYGIPAKRARLMDPQHRMFLDASRDALEDAGFLHREFARERTGVYVGFSVSEHKSRMTIGVRAKQLFDRAFGRTPHDMEALASFMTESVPPIGAYSMVGQMHNMAAANVARAFDLQGPVFSTDAACASALVALAEAVLHLRDNRCDVAIVGGTYAMMGPDNPVAFAKIGALSRRNECRPWDDAADGFVLGEGAGALVLKRLDDALRDGDRIWSVVRGVGLSNDGRAEGPMTPRRSSQVRALAAAYDDAQVDPGTLGYLEAHGTGTRVGDATEIESVSEFFGRMPHDCAVGSVKANIGHSLSAAGAAGLIKAALVLGRRYVPPQAHYTDGRKDADAASHGFVVPTTGFAWTRAEQPRRAGVNSFGFGGTNVHAVLEEAPRSHRLRRASSVSISAVASSTPTGPVLIPLSAPSRQLLVATVEDLSTFVGEKSFAPPLHDIAASLVARPAQDTRLAFFSASTDHLIAQLEIARGFLLENRPAPEGFWFGDNAEPKAQVGVLFGGVDCDWAGVERLYRASPGLRADVADLLDRLPREVSRTLDVGAELERMSGGAMARSCSTQALAAVVQIAAGRRLGRLGLVPAVAVGSGLGSAVAGCFSGTIGMERLFESLSDVAEEGRCDIGLPLAMPSQRQSHPRARTVALSAVASDARTASLELTPAEVQRLRIDAVSNRHRDNWLLDDTNARSIRMMTADDGAFLDFEESLRAADMVTCWVQPVGRGLLQRAHQTSKATEFLAPEFIDGVDPLAAVVAHAFVCGAPTRLPRPEGARLASLPPSRLATRYLNLVRTPTKRAALPSVALVEELRGHDLEPTGIAPVGRDLAEVQQTLVGLLAGLTAFPKDGIRLEHRLGADLGFDSLMEVELGAAVAEAWVGVESLPRELFANDASVGQIADYILEASSAGKARPAEVSEGARPILRYAARRTIEPLPWQNLPHQRVPWDGQIGIIPDERGIAAELAGRLQRAGARVCLIEDASSEVDGVIDLRWISPDAERPLSETDFRSSVEAVFRLARSQRALNPSSYPCLFAVGFAGTQHAGVCGLLKALHHEWSPTLVKSIEVDPSGDPEAIAGQLFDELVSGVCEPEVRYSAGVREVVRLTPSTLRPQERGSMLAPDTTVAISGGSGVLGRVLARDLVVRHCAKVILLGRRALDPELESFLAELNQHGRRAVYYACDVTRAAELGRALDAGRAEFGGVEVVVHAAGWIADAAIEDKAEADFAGVFDAKVSGALNLWAQTQRDPLRMFLQYGSWAGRFGNAHQSDYAAANHLLGRLAPELGRQRPDVRVVTLDLPPWQGSAMVESLPAAVRQTLERAGVPLLSNEDGLHHVLAELAAGEGPSEEALLGQEDLPRSLKHRLWIDLSKQRQSFLEDHQIGGAAVLPLAAAVDYSRAAARRVGLAASGKPLRLRDFRLFDGVRVGDAGTVLAIDATAQLCADGTVAKVQVELYACPAGGERKLAYSGTVELLDDVAEAGIEPIAVLAERTEPSLTLDAYYEQHTFHGPSLRAVTDVDHLADRFIAGSIRSGRDRTSAGEIDIVGLDAALQLCGFYTRERLGRAALPVALGELVLLSPLRPEQSYRCRASLEQADEGRISGAIDISTTTGDLVMQLRDVRAELFDELSRTTMRRHATRSSKVEPAHYDIALFPEVREIQQRISGAEASGIANPYFNVHERVTNETSVIGGREVINFSSYNYLGLSGHPSVSKAAQDAVERFGTSVSASRIASGEKPIHRHLEEELADFLGCEDSIAMVGGHATNVSVIGHILGPRDLIVHDSLAHDSILGGAKLSGAKRIPFPHNDVEALDALLTRVRPSARRVLIATEGVFSMDGDVAPLAGLIEVKKRHGAMLFVDEAHSLGTVGATGRGIGELAGVDRNDVELWMGTLSKALASCGGYIAGSRHLIQFLKYTAPGFVYSVGISPANCAAALAALRELRAQPELVGQLRERSALFLRLCKERGLNTGMSDGTPVVPCIVPNSMACLQVSQAMARRGVNVQPILYPAVEEEQARLRFFITARHTESQLHAAADALAEELQKINPDFLAPRGVA